MELEDKIYYQPGDIVTIKQDIPNKPTMVVVKKETSKFRQKEDNSREDYFVGMRCRWYTVEGELQEAIYNTKDLIKL